MSGERNAKASSKKRRLSDKENTPKITNFFKNLPKQQTDGNIQNTAEKSQAGTTLVPREGVKKGADVEMTPKQDGNKGTKKAINRKLQQQTGMKQEDEPKIRTEFEDSERVTLTFGWKKVNYENKFTISGNKRDVLIDVLKTSDNFKEKFNDSLYLLVHSSRSNTAISPYVPIGALPSEEHLDLTHRKTEPLKIHNYTQGSDGIFFTLSKQGRTKGGKERKILLNKSYCPGDLNLGVYGYKEQTIQDAILSDGRFNIDPDTKYSLRGKEQYESHIKLWCLKDDIYTVEIHNKKPSKGKPDVTNQRIPGTQNEPNVPSGASAPTNRAGRIEEEEHLPSSSISGESGTERVEFYPLLLPQYKKLYKTFTKNFAETYGSVISPAFEALTNNIDILKKHSTLATTQRILAQHLDSVGHITVHNDQKSYMGTCFLLTDSIVLTCFHVVEPVLPRNLLTSGYRAVSFIKARPRQSHKNGSNSINKIQPRSRLIRKARKTLTFNARRARLRKARRKSISESQRILRLKVCISFNYESDDSEKITYKVRAILAQSRDQDFIFLELDRPVPGARGLMPYLAFPPKAGAVTISGHPEGDVKETDLCSLIKYEDRESEIIKHPVYVHVLTKYSFREIQGKDTLTYDSCFYHGASGSPVFDEKGKLVAMHTGGYPVDGLQEKASIIEFGRSCAEVIIRGAVEIKPVRRALKECVKKDEYLKKEISEIYKHSLQLQPVIRRLQQLWKSERDPDAQSSLESHPFSEPETPMEIDSQ